MGFEPATLGLGIRSALFLPVPPSVGECRPVRVLAAILVASVSPNPLQFRSVHLQDNGSVLGSQAFTLSQRQCAKVPDPATPAQPFA